MLDFTLDYSDKDGSIHIAKDNNHTYLYIQSIDKESNKVKADAFVFNTLTSKKVMSEVFYGNVAIDFTTKWLNSINDTAKLLYQIINKNKE